jgi:nucleoside-diphosphate-sugar epimerase
VELAGKTLLITGIGGFIGRRTAQIATARGMQVWGLELDAERARSVEDSIRGARVIVGDGTDPAVVAEAVRGVDIILHTAAIVKEGGPLTEFRRVNVEGTRMLAEAARNAGVSVFIQLSSVMVYGFRYPDLVAEDGPLRGEGNPYCITKIESEAAVMQLHDPDRFDVIIIRPGDVYGPGSLPWVVRPLDLMRRGMFALVDGGRGIMNHVYVDNLVDGVLLAAEQPDRAGGLAFNITDGEATTWREYFTRLARAGGQREPVSVPGWLMKIAIYALNFLRMLFLLKPEVLPQGVDFVRRPHAVSIERARDVLDYEPFVDLREGLAHTRNWLTRGK